MAMAMTSLPPGFRFHPTDVELVMYYLKKKVMGKRLHSEAIAEVNIYKFSPWDLPDKSCLKSKDLEWYFFCPREKKYASGGRVKRATENGYWKTTGKDRPIQYNDQIVGTVKTLVFHLGHAPQGERTDWVIHEYRILDNQLAVGGLQDTYVLCKIFKKAGIGPMNGAQYGAPFDEAEWSEDDVTDTESQAIPITSDLPPATTPMLPSGLPLTDGGPPSASHPISEVVVDEPTPFKEAECSEDDVADTESQAIPIASDLPLNTTPMLPSGLPLAGGGPPSSGLPISEVFLDEPDDEITRLMAQFTDDDNFYENGANEVNLNNKGKGKALPCPDECGIFNGLGDLDGWAQMNEGRFMSGMQKDGYSLGYMGVCDQAYIEMNDFLTPLNCSSGVIESDRPMVGETVGSYYNHCNIPNLHLGSSSAVSQHAHASSSNQQPALPEQSYEGNIHLNMPQMVNNHDGFNGASDWDITEGQPVEGANFEGMERGTHRKLRSSRLMDSIPALTPSAAEHLFLLFYTFRGSSMHIKAEVTHGADECTNEALLFMMEGSSSCWCNMPLAVSKDVLLSFRNRLLFLVDFACPLALVYFYLNEKLFISQGYVYFCEIENLLYFVMPKVCYNMLVYFSMKFSYRICTIQLF